MKTGGASVFRRTKESQAKRTRRTTINRASCISQTMKIKVLLIRVISAALFRQLRVICAKTFRLRKSQFLASLQVCGWRVKDALNWWTRESGQHSPNALIRVSQNH